MLADTKLIAEPWDAAGLYQVGSFPFGRRWSEWNGRYRDDVRRFWRGDPGMTSAPGDPALRQRRPLPRPWRRSTRSTSSPATTASRCSTSSPTTTSTTRPTARTTATAPTTTSAGTAASRGRPTIPQVLALRRRQARNLIATLMLSQGVPMLLGGDEFLRTQQGNNNAWCQDNEISWVDWSAGRDERRLPPLRPPADRAAASATRPCGGGRFFRAGAASPAPDIIWHGVEPCQPDFGREPHARLRPRRPALDRPETVDRDFYIAFNAYWEPHDVPHPRLTLGPPLAAGRRHRPGRRPTTPSGSTRAPRSPCCTRTASRRSMIVLVSEARVPPRLL